MGSIATPIKMQSMKCSWRRNSIWLGVLTSPGLSPPITFGLWSSATKFFADHLGSLSHFHLVLLLGRVFQYFFLFSFLKGCRTKLDPSFIHISINSKGCSKTSVKMSWQARADTPGRGSLRWYWASISLRTVSSLTQHEITSSRIDWISCPLSLGSSKHFYLHSLWTHKSK